MKKTFILTMLLSFIVIAYASTDINFFKENENITANYLKSIQNNPVQLQQFFYAMPKGGDLHNHIDGAVYAEDLIRFGAKQKYCINTKNFTAYKNPNCPVDDQFKNIPDEPALYRNVIDAWSMRYFPLNLKPGLPHFFSTFPKMENVLLDNVPQAIASIANRAGRQNEEYLELMIGSSELKVTDAKGELPIQIGQSTLPQKNLNAWRKALLNNGLSDIIEKTKQKVLVLNNRVNQLMKCGTNEAQPGCKVVIRYQYFTRRELPPNQFFAQLVTAFAVANSSSVIKAINIVMPENWNQALKYYKEQMQMIGFLRRIYPKAHVSLHAGELAFDQVEPKYLRYDVNEAVNIAHADRIGHGVDIPYEDNSQGLLKEMAKKHIDIEVNLTSNEDVLGISGKNHPLPLFLANHVPVTLSTDDEGIERTDLTEQYKIAELNYGLPYKTIKEMVRNNLTYGFVQGKSLWLNYTYKKVVPECANQVVGNNYPSKSCQTYLNSNLKAKLQWHLEEEFHNFERKIASAKLQE